MGIDKPNFISKINIMINYLADYGLKDIILVSLNFTILESIRRI